MRLSGNSVMHKFRRLLPPLMAAAIGAGTLVCAAAVAAGPAAAATSTPRVTYQEVRGVGKTYEGAYSGDWVHCNYITKAKYTQTANCSKGRTVTESVSGNVGYSYASISASVGFNVSFSTTVTAGNAVTIKPGGYGWFDVGFRYQRYRIGMERRTCVSPGPCGPWSKPDWVTVQRHLGNTFHYFGTGAV